MQFGFILSLIFAVLVTIFAVKNANVVLIDFIFGKVNISQALVILLSAILGALIVAIMGSVRSFKLKRELKELNKKIELLGEENNNYRILLEEKENDIVTYDQGVEEKEDENS